MHSPSPTTDPDRPPANSNFDPPASVKNDRLWGYEAPAVVEERVFNNWKVFRTCDQCTCVVLGACLIYVYGGPCLV